MIAIYLKTSVVLPCRGKRLACSVIHPSIDRILLKNLAQINSLKHLANLNWILIEDDNQYFSIVDTIRAVPLTYNWRLESYWTIKGKINGKTIAVST